MVTLAHKLLRTFSKILLLILMFCLAARLIDASTFISYETSSKFSDWLYGASSQENFDDLWFFADVGLSLIAAIVGYWVIMLIIRRVRH